MSTDVAIDRRAGIEAALWGETSARRAALLRILPMVVWIHDLLRMGPFVDLHYDPPFGRPTFWFVLWGIASVAVLLGLWTRFFAALGLVVSTVMVTLGNVIYHIDYYVLLTFFYLLFVESDRAWSVRAWLDRRRGLAPAEGVWAGPVTMMSLHLASIYLNAGLSHLLLNRSWREGYVLSQSFANPQWRSPVGELLGRLDFPTALADHAAVGLELVFAPLWFWALLRPPANALRAALAGAAISFHLGIALFLNIGGFSHFLIAVAVVFLPPALFGETPGARLRAATQGRRLVVGGLGLLVAGAFLVQPGLDRVLRHVPLLGRLSDAARSALVWVGDARHHDVFQEAATMRVHYVVAYFEDGPRREVWPLFFDESGERVGWAADMRLFMSLRLPLRGLGTSVLADRPFVAADALRLLRFALPLLERDLARPRNAWVRAARLEIHAYQLGRSLGEPYSAGPRRRPLVCLDVSRDPAPRLAPRPCAPTEGS